MLPGAQHDADAHTVADTVYLVVTDGDAQQLGHGHGHVDGHAVSYSHRHRHGHRLVVSDGDRVGIPDVNRDAHHNRVAHRFHDADNDVDDDKYRHGVAHELVH